MNNNLIHPQKAIIFLLQREYLRECKIEPIKNESGEIEKDENGNDKMKAVHPNNWTYFDWAEKNNLIVKDQKIIKPNNEIIKKIK